LNLKAVRGWIIGDEDMNGRRLFEAHSVIEDAGELHDITLPDQATCNTVDFLRHIGSDREFFAVEKTCRQTEYPFLRPEDMDHRGADDDESEL
jgi:hypothetical protein